MVGLISLFIGVATFDKRLAESSSLMNGVVVLVSAFAQFLNTFSATLVAHKAIARGGAVFLFVIFTVFAAYHQQITFKTCVESRVDYA